MLHTYKVRTEPEDHVFIVIECEGKPTVSIDVMSHRGRRGLGVRLNGHGFIDFLLDVEKLPSNPQRTMFRFCPYCGEKLNIISSAPHTCSDGFE